MGTQRSRTDDPWDTPQFWGIKHHQARPLAAFSSSPSVAGGGAHPEAGQVALQLLVEQEVDGQRVAGPVGEHGVDDIAVLVAQLLRHVQQDALAQVLQVDPAQGQRQGRSSGPSSQ